MGFYLFFLIVGCFFAYLVYGNTGPIDRDSGE